MLFELLSKSLYFILLFCIFINTSYSSSYRNEIPSYNICKLDGSNGFFWTQEHNSEHKIPYAYKWLCDKNVPELSLEKKEKLYNKIYSFFNDRKLVNKEYSNNISPNAYNYWYLYLNSTWNKFLKETFYPNLKKVFDREYKKEVPNLEKIATINFISEVVVMYYSSNSGILTWDVAGYIDTTFREEKELTLAELLAEELYKKDK